MIMKCTSCLTLFHADGDDGAAELQAFVPIAVNGTGGALNPWASLEVDGVQRDYLGGGEKGVDIHFPHRAGDTIWPSGGTDKPTIVC